MDFKAKQLTEECMIDHSDLWEYAKAAAEYKAYFGYHFKTKLVDGYRVVDRSPDQVFKYKAKTKSIDEVIDDIKREHGTSAVNLGQEKP